MIKSTAVDKLQNAFRNKRAINEFATEYAKKLIEERKVMNDANNVISQINEKKQSAATTIQNAFIKKKLRDEQKNKERQKEVFKKYTELYQPQGDLILKGIVTKPTEPKLSVESDRRDRQRKVYQKYSNLYQHQNNLRYKPF